MATQLLFLLFAIGAPTLAALILSGKAKERRAWLLSLCAIGVVVVNILALGIGAGLKGPVTTLVGFELSWNWSGKIIAIVLTLAMYGLLPRPLRAEAGVFALPRTTDWKSVVTVSALLLVFFWCVSYLFRDGETITKETMLFQATMPGLDEEPLYRGVLLALLVSAFGKPWRIAGVGIGWGALPVVLFFGLAHAFSQELDIEAVVSVFAAIVMGAGFLWIKEKTGSIWIAVLVHNLANVGSTIVASLQP
jgi:MFS family permease